MRNHNAVAHTMLAITAMLATACGGNGGSHKLTADPIHSTITMLSPRMGFAMLQEANGNIVLVGGRDNSKSLTSCEGFSPVSESFFPLGNMMVPRYKPAVCQMPDGRIVIIGGGPSFANRFVIDVLHPDGSWSQEICPSYNQQGGDRMYTTFAASFSNGKFLFYDAPAQVTLADGSTSYTPRVPTLFDTNTVPWSTRELPEMGNPQWGDACLQLPNGDVVVSGIGGNYVIYNPVTETTTKFPMAHPRQYHNMLLMPDGKVQCYGGVRWASISSVINEDSVETFDPATGKASVVGHLCEARGFLPACLLPNGDVLLSGGPSNTTREACNDQVVYNYLNNTSVFTSDMLIARTYHQGLSLKSGRVIFFGGIDGNNHVLDVAEIFGSKSAIRVTSPSTSMDLGSSMQMQVESGGPVTWGCNVGTITSTGFYTAPAAPTDGSDSPYTTVVISATSTSDPSNVVHVTIQLTMK